MISISTTKSSSNWLDRLRSSRGFPTGNEPDLNRFLSTSTSGSLPTTHSTRSESTQSPFPRQKPSVVVDVDDYLGEVSNVLCELFHMGDKTSRSKKKPRKQTNPRFHGNTTNDNNDNDNEKELCSSDDLRREKSENGVVSSGDNSLNERRVVDLKSYTRSEVFVVDTSLPDWKFDGWMFRNDDDWKTKEKKNKTRVFNVKNKKNNKKLLVSSLNNDDEKKIVKIKDDQNKGQSHNDRKDKPFKEAVGFPGKVPQNRFPCPRPPEKLGNEGSSVILLKSIPLNDSNVAPKFEKRSRKRPPKKMKIV